MFTIGLNRAVTLLAERASKGGRASTVIKELGEHPELGGKMQVLNGRYGPYVKHGKINATLPRNSVPEQLTLEEAVALVAAKAEKGGKSGKRRRSAAKPKADADADTTA